MSCVVGQKLGRIHAPCSPETSARYSVISSFVFRHVKYVYDWWKPILASVCIIAGRVNASDRKITSGWSARTDCQDPRPEVERLGVRVVDAEQRHPVVDPHLQDPADLGVDALGVVVEVQRVDVLVLLRRVLRVRDRAVGPRGEPLRVRGHPRVVGRALQRDVERHLHARGPRAAATNASKSSNVPSVGSIASCPPAGEPIAYGEPGSPRSANSELLRALAVRLADGVHGRQVDDVEAHAGDPRQVEGRGAQRPGLPLPGRRVVLRALRAREQLVPGAGEGERAVDDQRVGGRRASPTSRSGCAASAACTCAGQPGREPRLRGCRGCRAAR